jgi:hypothetical protein
VYERNDKTFRPDWINLPDGEVGEPRLIKGARHGAALPRLMAVDLSHISVF